MPSDFDTLRELLREYTVTGYMPRELMGQAAEILGTDVTQVSPAEVRQALETRYAAYGGKAPRLEGEDVGREPGTSSTINWQRTGTGKQMRVLHSKPFKEGEEGHPSQWEEGYVSTPESTRQWPTWVYEQSFMGVPSPQGEMKVSKDPSTLEGRLKIAKYAKKPWTSSYEYPDLYQSPRDVVDPRTGEVTRGRRKLTHLAPMKTGEKATRVPEGVNLPMVFTSRDITPEGQIQAPKDYVSEAELKKEKLYWFPKGKEPSFTKRGTRWKPGQDIVPFEGAQPLDLGLGRYATSVEFRGATPLSQKELEETGRESTRRVGGQDVEGQWVRLGFRQRMDPAHAQLMARSGLFKHQLASGQQVTIPGFEKHGVGALKEPGAQSYAYWQAHPEERAAALQEMGLPETSTWRDVGYQLHQRYREKVYPEIKTTRRAVLHDIPTSQLRAPFGTAEEGKGMYGDLPIERVTTPREAREGRVDVITKPMEMVAGDWFTQLSMEWPIRRHNVPAKEMRALERTMPKLHAQLQKEALPRRMAYASMINTAQYNAGRAEAPSDVVDLTARGQEAIMASARTRAKALAETQGVEPGELQPGVMSRMIIESAAERYGGKNIRIGDRLIGAPSHVKHFTTTGDYIFEEASQVGRAFSRAIEMYGTEKQGGAVKGAAEAVSGLATGRNFFQMGMRAWTERSRAGRLLMDPALPSNRIVMPEQELVRALGIQEHPHREELLEQYRSGEWSPKGVVFGQPTPGEEYTRGAMQITSPQYAREQGWLNLEDLGQRMVLNPQAGQFLGRDADGDPIYAIAGEQVAYKDGEWTKTDLTGAQIFTEEQIQEGAIRAHEELGRPSNVRGEEIPLDVDPSTLFTLGQGDVRQAMVEDYYRGHGKYIGRYYNLLEDAWSASRKIGRGKAGEELFRTVHGRTQGKTPLPKSLKRTMDLMATATKTGWSADALKQVEGIDVEQYQRTLGSGYSQSFISLFEELAGGTEKGALTPRQIAELTAGPGKVKSAEEFVRRWRGAKPGDERAALWQETPPSEVLGSFAERVKSPLGAALFAHQLRRERARAERAGEPFRLELPQDIPESEQLKIWQQALTQGREFKARRLVGSKLRAGQANTTPMGYLSAKVDAARELGYGLAPFLSGRSKGPGKWQGTISPSAVGGDKARLLVNALARGSRRRGLGKGVSGGGSIEGEAGSLIHKQMESMFELGGDIETEKRVSGKFAGQQVSGRVDVWNPASKKVIDIKTATSLGTDRELREEYGHQLRLYSALTGAESAEIWAPRGETVTKIRRLRNMFESKGITSWTDATPDMVNLAEKIGNEIVTGGRKVSIDLGEEAMEATRGAVQQHVAQQTQVQRWQETGQLPTEWSQVGGMPARYGEQMKAAEELIKEAPNKIAQPPFSAATRPPGKASASRQARATTGIQSTAERMRARRKSSFGAGISKAGGLPAMGDAGGQKPPEEPPSGAPSAAAEPEEQPSPEDSLIRAVMELGERIEGGGGGPDFSGVPEGKFVDSVNKVSKLFDDWAKAVKPAIDGTRDFTKGELRLTKKLGRMAQAIDRGLKYPEKASMWSGAAEGPWRQAVQWKKGGKIERLKKAYGQAEIQELRAMLGGGDEGGGGFMTQAARGIKRLAVGWAPMQMRRAWGMLGAPAFKKYMPAAAEAEMAGWGMTQAIGGYAGGGLPEGVAGGVIRARAQMQQAQINAGRSAYRAYGGLVGAGSAMPGLLGVAGPAAGAGLVSMIGLNAVGATAAAGPVGAAVAGAAGLYGGYNYLRSYGPKTAENAFAATRGGGGLGWAGYETTGAFRAAAGNLIGGGLTRELGAAYRDRGIQGLSNQLATNLQASADVGISQQQLGEELRGTRLSAMSAQNRMASLNFAARNLHGQEGTIWSGMDEGSILKTLGGFATYTQALEGMTPEQLGQAPPEWMTRATALGVDPAQYAKMAQGLGMGIEGTEELVKRFTPEGASAFEKARAEAQVGKFSWMRQYGTAGEDILQYAGSMPRQTDVPGEFGGPSFYFQEPEYSGKQIRYAKTVAGILEGTRGTLMAQGVMTPEVGPGVERALESATPEDQQRILQQAVSARRGAQMVSTAAQKFGLPAQALQQALPEELTQQQYYQMSQAISGQGRLPQMQQLGQALGMSITPQMVTRGPAGLRIGTAAPVGYGMTMPQFQAGYQQANARMMAGKATGDFVGGTTWSGAEFGGWGEDTAWGLQDAMSAEGLRHSMAQAGFTQRRLALREERLAQEEAGEGPNALARQLQYVTALGGESPVTPGYQYTGRFPMMYQQEAMNFGYQQQQFGLQQRRMDVNQMWQQQQFQWQAENLGIRQNQFGVRQGWQREDWAFQQGRSAREFGWQMEDYEENIRFATGRQRERLQTQQERAVIRYGEQRGRFETGKERQEQMWKWQEQAFEREEEQLEKRKAHAEELADLQQRQHDMQVQRAEEAHQFRLQQIEEQEQGFKDNWEIQEEKREEDLEYARKNLEIAKDAAAEAAGHAKKMAALREEMRNVQREQAVLISEWQQLMSQALMEVLKELDPELGAVYQGFLDQHSGADHAFRGGAR